MKTLAFGILCCSFIGLFALSCSGSLPEPTHAQVQWASDRWAGIDAETLTQGRQTYITKCSGCHSVKIPSRFTEAQWDSVMRPMSASAKLSNDEYEMILRYVQTMSKK